MTGKCFGIQELCQYVMVCETDFNKFKGAVALEKCCCFFYLLYFKNELESSP